MISKVHMTLLTRNLSLKQTDRFVSQSSLACLTGLNNFATFKFFCVPLRKHVTYNKGFNRNIPHAKPSSSVIEYWWSECKIRNCKYHLKFNHDIYFGATWLTIDLLKVLSNRFSTFSVIFPIYCLLSCALDFITRRFPHEGQLVSSVMIFICAFFLRLKSTFLDAISMMNCCLHPLLMRSLRGF